MLLPDDRCPAGHRRPDRDGFCAIALEDWIEAAERAGVPYVPARLVAEFEVSDLRQHETVGPHQKRLDVAFAEMAGARRPGTMARWDCCAPAWLKAELSDGEWPDPCDPQFATLPVDARLLEVLEAYPRIRMPAFERPWLGERTIKADGYPAEYRAFIEEGKVVGISSYYPQRDLRRSEEEIEAVTRLSAQLAGAIEPPMQWALEEDHRLKVQEIHRKMARVLGKEPVPAGPSPDGVHATADFVATTDGMLFLEGGPPWWMGAHPCCFPADRKGVRGVRLAAGPDSAYRPVPR